MGEFAAAVPDLAKAADREPDDLYYAIWLYLARARAGEADAAAELERRAAAITDDGWPRRIVEMLLGKRGPDALLPSSTGDERRRSQFLCDAGFYAGQYHLLRGDARKARSAFESAVATGAVNQITFQKAEAELRRLAG
jgi:lipoprotein NlpI